MKSRNFDDILNECIERMLGGESIEACLASYPEHAVELEPLLRTAQDALPIAMIKPRPDFRQQAGIQFQTALLNLKPVKHGFFSWHLRWATVVVTVVIILLAGGGTVYASNNSLPDNPLYAVKLATENVRLALTTSALGKAELYAEFADRRVDEIIKMADKGDAVRVVQITERMSSQLLAIANLSLPATAGEEKQALMAVSAPEAAPGSAQDANLQPASVPSPELKAVKVPAYDETDNLTRASLSAAANATAARNQEKQPVQAERVPATARTIEPETTIVKREKIKVKNSTDLETVVSEQAAENTRDLEDALEKAPDAVKAAVERAIEVADNGYDEVLKNIGR